MRSEISFYSTADAMLMLDISRVTIGKYAKQGVLRYLGHGKYERASVDRLAAVPPGERRTYIRYLRENPEINKGKAAAYAWMVYLPLTEDPEVIEEAWYSLLGATMRKDSNDYGRLILVSNNFPVPDAAITRLNPKVHFLGPSYEPEQVITYFDTESNFQAWKSKAAHIPNLLLDSVSRELTILLDKEDPEAIFLDDLEPKDQHPEMPKYDIVLREHITPKPLPMNYLRPEYHPPTFDPEIELHSGRGGLDVMSMRSSWVGEQNKILDYLTHCVCHHAYELRVLWHRMREVRHSDPLVFKKTFKEVVENVARVKTENGFHPLRFSDITGIQWKLPRKNERTKAQVMEMLERGDNLLNSGIVSGIIDIHQMS